MNKKLTLQMVIAGSLASVALTEEMKPAHGTGLDGVTQVKSLHLGKSDDHPDKILVQDSEGNNMITTADEIFVAAQIAAEQKGFRLTATKIS